MWNKHLFVSIDGVDGVGKTTVARLLVANSFFKYYKSPSGIFVQLREEVDLHSTPLERYCFYRIATQFDSVQINQLLKNNSIVCDRYISSTLAYHVAMDDRIKTIHNSVGLIKPDFSFLLGARPEIRDKRINERALLLSDKDIERNSSFLNRVAEIFMSLNLIYIDTSDITSKEVVIIIKNTIKKGGVL